MRKNSKKILSLVLCIALLLTAFISVQPIMAQEENEQTESVYSIVSQFENGENPFPVVDNVYEGKEHPSVDSQYIGLSEAEEALNGEASLKINVKDGNARTDVILAEPKLNSDKAVKTYITSKSDDKGILLRLKINGDSTADGHKFAVRLFQSGLTDFTHLANGAILYDLKGNATTPASASLDMTIPSGFDGFVYLPFASARSKHVCKEGSYDNYTNNPDCMVDYTKPYSILIMLGSLSGDASWSNTEVLIDDICVIGAADGAVFDTMRSFGYSDVLYSAQPEKYTMNITHENLWQPIQSFQEIKFADGAADYTYSLNASLTNDKDEVLLGDISAKITTETVNNGTTDGVIESFRTNTITFEGVEALSTDKIVAAASDDYAYLKMRIKVPANEAGSTYNIWPVIKQGNNCYRFEFGGLAYNADGTKNSSIPFAKNKIIQLPSGFDGYIYMPVWSLRDTDWNLGQRSTTAYQTKNYTDPALDNDFDFFIHFAQNGYNLDNAEIIIDDMEFVFGDVDNGQMPFTFDEMVYTTPTAQGYANNKWFSLNNITHITGKDALNGDSSLMFDVQDVYSTSGDTTTYYSYAFAKFSGINGITDENVGGVMFRLKLLNDTTTGTGKNAHQMFLTLEKSGYASTCVGGNSIQLFDTDGKPVPTSDYAKNYMGVYVPAGFDGFVFFPISSLSKRTNSTSDTVNITDTFDMQIWFPTPKNWAGVDAVIDDVSLYNIADSTVGLTETDAINAIKSQGYSVKWAEQPEVYDLSFDFEDYMRPFDSMNSVYNGSPTLTLPTEAELVQGEEALSGNTSLKFTAVRDEAAEAEGRKYQRAETSYSTFKGIDGLDKDSIANNPENYAYLTMRIKVPNTAEDGYKFNMYAKQDGVTDNAITRLRAEYGYTANGEYVEFTVKDGVSTLPAGFDGIIYMPFKKATSTFTLTTGMRAMYGNSFAKEDGTVLYGNDYMVDFSKQFDLRFYLSGDTWADTVIYVDDIQIKHFERADFDNSGNVDADDILALSRYILGANTVKNEAYDLNGDGFINVIDVVRIKRIIAGEVIG